MWVVCLLLDSQSASFRTMKCLSILRNSRQSEYLAMLKKGLPAYQEAIGAPQTMRSSAEPPLKRNATPRGIFSDMTFSNLRHPALQAVLPDGWMETTTASVKDLLAPVAASPSADSEQLFLACFVHPTFIRSKSSSLPLTTRQLRAAAMPSEAVRAGAAALRLLEEVSLLHQPIGSKELLEDGRVPRNASLDEPPAVSPPLTSSLLLSVALASGFASHVLYDSCASFVGGTLRLPPVDGGLSHAIPQMVVADAFTSFCGAVDLVYGTEAVGMLLDRFIPPVPAGSSFEAE